MKSKEVKALNVEQLQQTLAEERERLLKLKFAHAVSPIENPMRIRNTRRLIARILTEITAKQ
ncbi:MAG: 50S ribosomal protein L29 [Runella slithyformis]|jgi:large subunit ribosomal protein L29|nr:MAG: 50S ribosomal protein L29 [Runella slithyformis]TAF98144.1 MAG: 50S ribosomal protein L29 [Runella sp.]TAG22596.1 MAG: 50S ribosomal protein L29 [Cytophagales bacterium]TAG41700.1 MAG: 50S ribosomal protein L29 [Cytophagia bacterium]TAE91448.1 MAG: 50S ribosomal protein L29 [Runella slithyformis]